ncbi:MAG: cbb3-type cytochrome oxidase assembly protein CcoS [Bacteroidetes Order II. Incertae sedis bacterium]|nr:cbb3-type cytochrome oxidase assembly protein CcoS [Bacteroidetes Order II. bacterium]MDG1753805.1 cbb3-type cytochrome oxidase assembly protein CcoS [Rhodothermales bacterium]MBT4051760.1 cbb3-type cytochrome oxidase assembly protein CcoS [Bacteroidetes Order II. bacterium]MBT4602024.1 cbb3-type cytochrome oxidase assembly protein CcoS [Bacteroidetes Order II. bacterium]MBT5250324.1 cbb3-type cytochrome oxidase assembly protein CcoS [Bacteroidetes Order II. bacterium]
MNILYFLVPLALMLAALGVWAFVWSVKSGQFDDVETPGMRVLFDDELQEPSKSDETEQINS